MKLEKITIPSHRDIFVRRMQDMILSGDLAIGARLPSERELAEGMGVSRSVINGGIEILVRQGFLKVTPRQGTFVADYRREGTLDTLNAILSSRGDVLTDQDIRSILEIRWAIEHLTMKKAMDHASEEDLARVTAIVEELGRADSAERAAILCFDFQKELAVIGGNWILSLIMSSFRPPVIALWQRFYRKYGGEVLYLHTLRSLSYLKEKDFEGAVDWLNQFISDALDGDYTVYSE